jgi:hypothetical protein
VSDEVHVEVDDWGEEVRVARVSEEELGDLPF